MKYKPVHRRNFLQKNAKRISCALCLAIFLVACDQDPYTLAVSDSKRDVAIQRFDTAFFKTDSAALPAKLPALMKHFPPFFEQNKQVYYWQRQLVDPLQQELYKEVQSVFPDLEPLQEQLNAAMDYYYYYFQNADTVRFYTYVSRLDFDYPVLYARGYCFIALDLYLGQDAAPYQGRPRYLNFQRQPEFLLRDVMAAILEPQLPSRSGQSTLLEDMVYYGKWLHLLRRVLPHEAAATLMKYSPEDWRFCQEQEREMWAYFVENQLLYRSDEELKRRFILEAPFSKFRTPRDRQTPGRVGRWLGWQMVEQFARKGSSLKPVEEVLRTDARELLRASGYRP